MGQLTHNLQLSTSLATLQHATTQPHPAHNPPCGTYNALCHADLCLQLPELHAVADVRRHQALRSQRDARDGLLRLADVQLGPGDAVQHAEPGSRGEGWDGQRPPAGPGAWPLRSASEVRARRRALPTLSSRFLAGVRAFSKCSVPGPAVSHGFSSAF